MVAKKAPEKSNVSKDDLLKYYREMLLIRRFEEKAGQLYGMGLIGGFCHLYIGQEAVVVGLEACTKPGDKRLTSYRDHGHMLACGMSANGVMAELTGREGGYSKGKGGSMHMFSKEKHFYGGHGIVGGQVSLGTGLAFANRCLHMGAGKNTFSCCLRLFWKAVRPSPFRRLRQGHQKCRFRNRQPFRLLAEPGEACPGRFVMNVEDEDADAERDDVQNEGRTIAVSDVRHLGLQHCRHCLAASALTQPHKTKPIPIAINTQ